MICGGILHRRAIEQEKVIYSESFEKLRVLKPEIEHIRKVMGYFYFIILYMGTYGLCCNLLDS